MTRESFLLYTDQIEPLLRFSDEDCGRIFKSLIAYATDREVPEMQPAAAIAWEYIRRQLDRDGAKYEKKVKARAEAGRKGAEKRWQNMANDGKNSKRWQTMAKIADNDTVPDTDTDTVPDTVPVPDTVEKDPAGTHGPTAGEVKKYAKSIDYDIDAQGFVDKYSATGWVLNGGPIRDWKALVRRWKTQDEKRAPAKNEKIHNFDERGDDLDDETARKWREKIAARRAEHERTSVV